MALERTQAPNLATEDALWTAMQANGQPPKQASDVAERARLNNMSPEELCDEADRLRAVCSC